MSDENLIPHEPTIIVDQHMPTKWSKAPDELKQKYVRQLEANLDRQRLRNYLIGDWDITP